MPALLDCTLKLSENSLKWGKLLMLFAACLAFAAPASASSIPLAWTPFISEAEKIGAEQLLLVITRSPGRSRAELHCLENFDGAWKLARSSMAASVGRKGIADPNAKREGDGMSPFGVFPVGMAFGYGPDHTTRMPWRQMHKEDIWVDDPDAADYNQLVHISATQAKSFEYMRRDDDYYRLGLVVEYNTSPVVAGHGSAIFIHLWGRPFRSTAGCLGLPENHIESVLEFLDPARKPAIAFVRRDLMQ